MLAFLPALCQWHYSDCWGDMDSTNKNPYPQRFYILNREQDDKCTAHPETVSAEEK
jgi:hypothetical protein